MEMTDKDKEYKIINAIITDPATSLFKSSRNDRAECRLISCNNSENCQLYERNECAMLAVLGAARCPYGKRSGEGGFTKRARNYHSWISERKKRHKDHLRKLGSYKKMLAVVGDFVFLPYAHMNMNEHLPFLAKGGFMSSGSHFIPKESFTPDVVVSIIKSRPQALMGGEIKSYQNDVVPVFVKHLQELMPDMYNAVLKIYPEIGDRLSDYSYVGRSAYIHTLKSGTVVHKYHDSSKLATQDWLWDGEYLTSTNTDISFAVVEYDEIMIKIKPQDGATVKISSNAQVDEDTKFSN